MADSGAPGQQTPGPKPTENAPSKAPKAPRPPNPVFRMMGLPNFRLRLPSRNWMIFFTITGSFTGAIMYDRRQKKLAQQKWCKLVSHLAQEPLPVNTLRRKLRVYLASPPGDSFSVSKGYFRDYVKPILDASAIDWEVVEGRREGELRAKLAEQIRKRRRKAGEAPLKEGDENVDTLIEAIDEKLGIAQEDGSSGDIVIGRHTWKEYLRGLHEGWLGPMERKSDPNVDEPPEFAPDAQPPLPPPSSPLPDLNANSDPLSVVSDTSISQETLDPSLTPSSETPASPEPAATEEEKKPTPPTSPTPPYLTVTEYPTSPISHLTPSSFDPSLVVPQPHILGFLNFPIRIYRFLTQRYLAESVGREVAAIVLAGSTRPYAASESYTSAVDPDDPNPSNAPLFPTPDNDPSTNAPGSSDILVSTSQSYEQSSLLASEEPEWPKRVRHPKVPRPEGQESVRLDPVVMDPRIAGRMSTFLLDPEEEERARRIVEGREGVKGERWPPANISAWEFVMKRFGLAGDENERGKVILGNLDGEDGE